MLERSLWVYASSEETRMLSVHADIDNSAAHAYATFVHELDQLLRDRPRFTLEELAATANAFLEREAQEPTRDARVKTAVNPRLIRHYIGQDLLEPALREGRHAVYTVDHLMQLLALRHLLVEGYPSKLIGESLRALSNESLKETFEGRHDPLAPVAPVDDDAVWRAAARDTLDAILQRSPSDARVDPDTQSSRTTPTTPRPPAPAQRPAASALPTVDTWERLKLLDGVELHVRSDVRLPASRAVQQRLLDHLIQQIILHAQRRS